jgi:protein-arginine kinase activator protein McsA
MTDQRGELQSLKAWRDELAEKRPLSEREKLERALSEAVTNEDYEKAAQMRDALRNLKPTE